LPIPRQCALRAGVGATAHKITLGGSNQLAESTTIPVDRPQPWPQRSADVGVAVDYVEHEALIVHPPQAGDVGIPESRHDLGLTEILKIHHGQLHPSAFNR